MRSKLTPAAATVLLAVLALGCTKTPSSTDNAPAGNSSMSTSSSIAQPGPSSQLMVPPSRR